MQELSNLTSALAQRTQLATFGSSSQQLQFSSGGADHVQPKAQEAQQQLQAMSSHPDVQHATSKAHNAGKSTASSFAFDPDSAIMYAVVNLESDRSDTNNSGPAKTQGAQSLKSMMPDSSQQHVDGSIDKTSDTSSQASQVPIIVAVSATAQLSQTKKDGPKSSFSQESQDAHAHSEETKSQQAIAGGSADVGVSADEIEVQFKGEIQEFASLAQLSSQSNHHVLFANERAVGTTRYELPESSVTHQGKVINFVDTCNQPQCMRFCPSLSNSDVQISHTGLTAKAIKTKDASGVDKETFVVANMTFTEGIHYWEIICPISIQHIQFGVISHGSAPQIVTQDFVSSTRRTIGVCLNLNERNLSFWVNGKHNKKQKNKPLKTPGLAWRPYIRFMEANQVAILKPFCRFPQPLQLQKQSNCLTSLPENMSNDSQYVVISYLADQIRNFLLIHNTQKLEDAAVTAEIHQHSKDVEILFPSQTEKSSNNGTVALLKFKTQIEANLFAQKMTTTLQAYSFLDAWNIAKLVHARFEPHPNYVLGFDKLTLAQLQQLKPVFSKFLITNLFTAEAWSSIVTNFGISEEKPHTSELQDAITNLEKLVKHQKMIGERSVPAILSQTQSSKAQQISHGPSNIAFLKNSNNVLVTNGPEVKVFAKEPTSNSISFANFSNYPQFPEDVIGLKLTVADLEFLIDNVCWKNFTLSSAVINFLKIIASQFSGEFVNLPYISALAGVTKILEQLQNQFMHFEALGDNINQRDMNPESKISKNPNIKTATSYRQLNKLLRIVLGLEEQLWAMTQSDQVHNRVKRLWPAQSARLHSAYARASSFVNFNDSEKPLALAELGLYNFADNEKKLSHFMDTLVPVETIYEDQGSIPLEIALEKQFTENYMLKGLDTFNIPLAQTLNNLPPSLHQNFAPAHVPAFANIDVVKHLPFSDLVLTGSTQYGSVNVWSSKLGMQLLGGFNFMNDFYKTQVADQAVSFRMKQLKGQYTDHDVDLLLKKIRPHKPMQANSVAKPSLEQVMANVEAAEEDDLFAIFGNFQAQVDQIEEKDVVAVQNNFIEQSIDETEFGKATMTKDDVEILSLLDFHKAWHFAPKASVQPVVVAQQEEEKKAAKAQPVQVIDDAMRKVLDELKSLGFPEEDSIKAYNKAKKKDLHDVLDILSEEQEKKQKSLPKVVEQKIEYNVYNCEVCTFLNDPPTSKCSMCQCDAPASAIKVDLEAQKKKNDEALKEKQMAEDKARMDAEKEKERQEKAMKEEQDKIRRLEQAKNEIVDYFKNAKVLDYFVAGFNSGQSVSPLLSCAALFNSKDQKLDLHFISFVYKPDYVSIFAPNTKEFTQVLAGRQTVVESMYPVFVGNQLDANYNPQMSRKQNLTMAPSFVGVARINMSQITSIVQLGDNVTESEPIHYVIVGKRLDGKQSVVILKVDSNHDISVVANTDLTNSTFEVLRNLKENESVVRVACAQASEQSDKVARLLVQTNTQKLICAKITGCTTTIAVETSLNAAEQLIGTSNGVVCVQASNSIRTFSIDDDLTESISSKVNAKAISLVSQSSAGTSPVSEDQLLNLKIDPKKVTIASIDAYENLMQGAITPAASNATFKSGKVGQPSQQLFTKHTWTCESKNIQSSVGPMEIKFENPISLVSLNIDLNFETTDSDALIQQLSQQFQPREEQKQVSTSVEKPVEQTQEVIKTEKIEKSVPVQNLGPFSIKGFDSEDARPKLVSNKSGKEHYIPIIVKRNNGASFNCQNIPNRLVADNEKMFGSNYAKPEITFMHIDNQRIFVEKISIKTPTTSKTGAYPMGEGLIFLSDTLEHFENTDMFKSFTLNDYQNWRKLRQNDPRPLRPNEPVAFFQFDASIQITFELDEPKAARYIMLKPTGFRQKPNKLSQNPDNVPMEIQFFGVIGNTIKMSQPLECVQIHDPTQNISTAVYSDFTCEVSLLDSNETVASIANFKIDQLKVKSMSLSPKTLVDSSSAISKTCQIQGLSMIRITDSSISARMVGGFSVSLKSKSTKRIWKLTSASIYGQFTKVNADTAEAQNQGLFGQNEIPSSYYRPCLLAPKFFPVINQQIASILCDSSFTKRLRIRVMNFFKNIMRLDQDLIPLVFSQLDLGLFLQTNIVGQDQNCIQTACDFLQSFQQEPTFATSLFEILIGIVQALPEKTTPQNGYQALIGMLKWALPLDFKRTLQVLLEGLYSNIVMKKIKPAQTTHNIRYRTRQSNQQSLDCYPFDNQSFKKSEDSEKPKEKDVADQNQTRDKEDLLHFVTLTQTKTPDGKLNEKNKELKVVTTATFFEKVKLHTIKVYMNSTQQTQFLMDIEITSGPNIVFFKAYPLHTYNQLVEFADGTYGETKFAHALTIPRIIFEGTKLKIDIKFGPMISNIKDTAFQMPDVAFEFYGKLDDGLYDSASAKHEQFIESKKAQTKLWKPVHNCVPHHCFQVASDTVTTPVYTATDAPAKVSAMAAEITELFSEVDNSEKAQPKEVAVSDQMSPLEIIQRDLQTMVMGDEAGTLAISTCVVNIASLQTRAQQQAEKQGTPLVPEKSLAYFMALATDFTKLIKHIYTKMQGLPSANETLRDCFAAFDATGSRSLANVGIDLFTHFIAFDSGLPRRQMQHFLKEVLLKLMTLPERSEFFNAVIDKFLTVPNDTISQKAIVESLLAIDVPYNDLVLYLANGLGLRGQHSQLKQNPITMMYATMYMTEKLSCKLTTNNQTFESQTLESLQKTPKQSAKSKKEQAADYVEDVAKDEVSHDAKAMSCDEVFDIFYQIEILVCKNEAGFFGKEEQVALLMLAFQNIKYLGRVASMKAVSYLHKDPSATELLFSTTLQLNQPELLNLNQLSIVYDRMKEQQKKFVTLKKPNKEQLAGLIQHRKDMRELHTFHSTQSSIILRFLTGLIDLELGVGSGSSDSVYAPLYATCKKDKNFWLQLMSYAIDEYIKVVEETDQLFKVLSEKPELNPGDEFAEELPSKRTSEGSLQVLKSLIHFLSSKNKEVSSFEVEAPASDTFIEQNLSKIWSLTLNSLKTVQLAELVEARLLERLIEAFLLSSEKIKQTTYMQILQISKQIAESNKHGKFLCNLLETTIPHINSTLKEDSVVYAICQGWLDILILSGCTGEQGAHAGDKSKGIHYALDATDVSRLLTFASSLLVNLLNLGSFEGVAGANSLVMVRLNLTLDLLRVAHLAKDGETKAMQKMFVQCEQSEVMRKELKHSLDNILLWLVMNGREALDETYLSTLGNSSLQTPATHAVKNMTSVIKDILMLVSDCVQNLESIKIALSSLVLIVSNVNKGIAQRSKNESIGFDQAIALSNRTNALFTKLLSVWLVSEKAVNYFVFELKGFEFLLDTISCDQDESVSTDKATHADVFESSRSALVKSDLSVLVKQWQKDKDQKDNKTVGTTTVPTTTATNAKTMAEESKSEEEFKFNVPLAEIANQMTLLKTSANDPVASYARTDWSANKRANKSKIFSSAATVADSIEYKMLFKLPYLALLREIQVGFFNYWQNESVPQPVSVVLYAGVDEKDAMNHVFTLQRIQDNAFTQLGSANYGLNFNSFKPQDTDQELAVSKISQSLQNCQAVTAQYIQLSFRWQPMTCLENSPLATWVAKKHNGLALHYITLTGYDCTKTSGSYHKLILRERKKTATEAMAQICSGDFSQSLQVIANQQETVEKIKVHFKSLVQLMEIKAGLIEPIFISIASHNAAMGDWIINEFISRKQFKHAPLIGKLVLCDRTHLVNRLQIMLSKTVQTLFGAAQNQGQLTQTMLSFMPFVKVLIKVIYVAAPALTDPVDFEIDPEVVTSLINLIYVNSANKKEMNVKGLRDFIIMMIKPPLPFHNSHIDPYTYTTEVLLANQDSSPGLGRHMVSLASRLATCNNKLAITLFEHLQPNFEAAISKLSQKETSKDHHLKYVFKQITAVSSDLKVKQRLQSSNVAQRLYKAIKEDDPAKAGRIVKELDPKLKDIVMHLILKLSVGNSEAEKELTAEVLKDLHHLTTIVDLYFIDKVFSLFLHNEATLPVSLKVKSFTNRGPGNEIQWEPNFDQLSEGHQEPIKQQDFTAGFLPSALIDLDFKKNLIKAFKHFVGQNSQKVAQNALEGQWTLAQEVTATQGQISNYQKVWKSLENKGPIMILMKGTDENKNSRLYGGFIQAKYPACPAQFFDQESDYPISSTPGDFIFCSIQNQGDYFYVPSHASDPIAEVFLDYEAGGAISILQQWVTLTWSYDWSFAHGNTHGKPEDVPGLKKPTSAHMATYSLQFGKAEIWVCDTTKKFNQLSQVNMQSVKQKLLEQISTKSVKPHPWVDKMSSFNTFRAQPVFMVPSHITVKTMAKILLKQGVVLTTNGILDDISDMTIEEVYSRFMADLGKSERSNNILDFEFDADALMVATDEDLPSADSLSHFVAAQYISKNTFFDLFQDMGGIKQFISVSIAQLQLWKDQVVAQSWVLWLKELESFAKLPFFFQLFMKNKKQKDLLFKLMQSQNQSSNDQKKELQEEQKEAVQHNYKILSEAFSLQKDAEIRELAVESGLIPRILERLSAISGEKARVFEAVVEKVVEEEKEIALEKKESNYDPNVTAKARKGVGYSAKQGEIFNVNQYLENKKQRNEQIVILIDIITNLFASDEWEASEQLVAQMLESALLPILESAFRNGSFLDMAKEAAVYHSYCALTRAIASQKHLAPCLVEIDKRYKPMQVEPIYKLVAKLNDLASIFLNCLTEATVNAEKQQDESEMLARDVKKTYEVVMDVVDELLQSQQNENAIADALLLPTDKQYRALLESLRFDYMDMKVGGDYKHHYKSCVAANQTMPPAKMIRLAQELADLSNALPCNHTDAVYVRVDKTRVDMMKALICGAADTPYAHGCYEFDIFMENNYPGGPPKMNLMTTGAGAIRFNPNLYHCGKVCLSLLGTWRGQATENWDPKLSTILQLLLSTQAIIMSNEVYFNEPGFEGEAGTKDGERKNEGYANIVRYGNVKWAMLGQLKNPPKGFETVVRRHFYVKKAEILKDLYKWVDRAGKVEALYTGLTHDHNSNIAKDFQKSKTRFKEALEKEVKEFEEFVNKLDKPTNYMPESKQREQRKKPAQKKKVQAITEGQVAIDEVDVGYDDDKSEQIDTSSKHDKNIDVEDDAVKDRWSRYIGAMGVEAVAKQAAANIFVSGAGALGIEISKNLVLSGCKSFTLHDSQPVTQRDLSGQFFLDLSDGKTRSEVCLPRLQQLNFYVRCKLAPTTPIPLDQADYEKEPWNFQGIDVFILTEADYKTVIAVNNYCRAKGKKFIYCDLKGVFGRLFNDFGDFEVLDKNGEELQDCMIKSISSEEEAIVTLLDNNKHNLEDGDEIMFVNVEGMKLKQGEKQPEADCKSDSINDTIHKVKIINRFSFKIGDTRMYEPYQVNGIVKQLRMKRLVKFKPFDEVMLKGLEAFKEDENLMFSFAEKMGQNIICHIAFEALDTYRTHEGKMPRPWNIEDAQKFVAIAKTIAVRYDEKPEEWKPDGIQLKLLHLFSFQAQGVFNPMAAFFGGFIAQEAVKAITQKFTPSIQAFYYDASEVLPDFSPEKHCNTEQNATAFDDFLKTINVSEKNHRSDGLRICLGEDIVDKLAHSRIFMVGAGAIGCELLKNFAMLGVGTGKAVVDADKSKCKQAGAIVLTDPDIIEVSNLNRQFLFREKHLRKPKSQTAAAAAIFMNPELKGNVIARLDKVHEGTNHIFTNKFFEDLTLVTNALDNVQARKYVDSRCVTAKTPLLESGTLGPKGHVQVILPYKTESYGSMNDPEDNNEVPYCTLKMFPQETLHCVEWARDKFQKLFTQYPQSAIKILDDGEGIGTVSAQDITALKEGLKLLKKRPKNFTDCVEFARIKFEKLFNHALKQLIYTYPLDKKNEDGALFWSLPKRPPRPIDFDKDNLLHCSFVSALACLRANIFHIEIPDKNPRTDAFKKLVGQQASMFKPPEFVPDDSKAKEIEQSVNKEAKKEEEKKEEESKEEEPVQDVDDVGLLKTEFLGLYQELKTLKKKSFEDVVKPEDFEKDNDANFHIDFIYSSGNIRATCYKLDPMDWITVKLKAGRIVPALATTTAAIAGLQALELVKIVKGCKKDDYRNVFLNLAVPMMQATEPGEIVKTKLVEGLEVSLWDRWDVKNAKQMTLEGLIAHIEETYKGLEVRDVMLGNQPIYFHAIMNAPGKENDKKKTLSTTIRKLTESDSDDVYVDLSITCIRKDDEAAKILAGVPPVRVFF